MRQRSRDEAESRRLGRSLRFDKGYRRGIVRPAVTFGLVGAQIGLGHMWATGTETTEKAFARLGVFTMMVIRDWFASREKPTPSAV